MWLKKIKRKKLQFLLIFIIMLFTTAIFSFCIGFVFEVTSYIGDYYFSDINSDIFINTSLKSIDDSVSEWMEDNNDVKDFSRGEGIALTSVIRTENGSFDTNFLYGYLINDLKDIPWGIHFVEGEEKQVPEQGEIWITSVFADLHNVEVGDEITIEGQSDIKCKVSAIVNNALNPSATLGIDYFMMNEKDRQVFQEYDLHYLISIRVEDDVNFDDFYSEMMDQVGTHIGGVIFTKYLFVQIASMVGSIIGGIGIFAAVLILFGSIVIIRFILKSSLQNEFRQIGIYKAVGFTNNEIKRIYLLSFGVVIFIASVLGAILGGFEVNSVSGNVLCFVGAYSTNVVLILISGLISVVLLSAIVILSLMTITSKINKMSAVVALNANSEVHFAKHNRSVFKNISNVFVDAINDNFKNKKMSTLCLLMLSIVFYLLILFVNINYSINEIEGNGNIWFGTPKCNAAVSGMLFDEKGENAVLKELQNDDHIEYMVWGEMTSTAPIVFDTNKYDLNNSNIGYTVFNSFDDAGFSIIDGHNPKSKGEIAVSKQILQESGLKIGDKVELKINNDTKKFKICGSYVTKLNLGYNLRILSAAVDSEDMPYYEAEIYVQMKDDSYFVDLQKKIEGEYSGVSVDRSIPATKDTIYSIKSIANPVIKILVIAFVLLGLLNVINLVIVNNLNSRKSHGIMKALGFTTSYIFVKQIVKILSLSIIGILIGGLLNKLASGTLFAIAMGGIEGLLVNIDYSICIVGITMGLIFFIICVSCLSLRKIAPKELMSE